MPQPQSTGGNPTRAPHGKKRMGTMGTCDSPWSPRRVSGCQPALWTPSSLTPGPSASLPGPSSSTFLSQVGSWLHPTLSPLSPRSAGTPAQPESPQRQGTGTQAGPQQAGLPALPPAFPYLCRYLNDSRLYCSVPQGTDGLSPCLAPHSSPAPLPKPVSFQHFTGRGGGCSQLYLLFSVSTPNLPCPAPIHHSSPVLSGKQGFAILT